MTRLLLATLAPLLAFAPPSAQCGSVVTNATGLLPCLGFGNRADVDFAFRAKVVWGTSPASKGFVADTGDGRLQLVDKALWPKSFINPGDIVDIRGKTTSVSLNCVNANCYSIAVIGHVTPDPPIDATIDDILTGKIPLSHRVRIRGIVRDAFLDDIDYTFRHIIVTSGMQSLGISAITAVCSAEYLSGLIGAEVCITGCYMPLTTGLRRISKYELNINSTNCIEIVSPPQDPFSSPPVGSITLDETATIMNLGRHSAKGTVIAVWQHENFAIRSDGGNIVNVSLADGPPPSCREIVEVAGLPDTDLYRINLRRAIWRKTPGANMAILEASRPISATSLFTDEKGHSEIRPDFHGKAVSLRGLVVGVPSVGLNDGIVRLQCGDFTVPVDASATPLAVEGLEVGSKAEISGTCIVKTESWRPNEPLPHIRDVVLVVREPSDVKVLSRPPWWTPGRLLAAICALLAALVAFLLWNVTLRRLANKRGNELAQSKITQAESRLKVQERTRIAVELHDSIAQNLTGVSLELDSAEQLARKDTDGMLKHLGMASRTLQSCRNELRNCLWDLRSRALEEADLNEAIRRTVAPLVSNVDLAIRFNVPRKALADDTAHVVMRIVRELVMNAVFNGKASAVKIAGSLEGLDLRFSVGDDGCGFDPATRPGVAQGHFGLQGIQERINQFNGEIAIDSAPGRGTKVTISMRL